MSAKRFARVGAPTKPAKAPVQGLMARAALLALVCIVALTGCGSGGADDTGETTTSFALAKRRGPVRGGGGSATSPDAPAPAPAPIASQPATTTTQWVGAQFTPSNADHPNPERGFYRWSGDDFVTAYDADSVSAAYAQGHRLLFAKVDLGAWLASDMPAAWLTQLAARLRAVRAAGMKLTLLFAYDYSAAGRDASAERIERHLAQLRPVLAEHADVVPFMRAGFIGAWGEWHSSTSGHSCGYNSGSTPCASADANRARIRDALFANVPATTQIAFRYPDDLRKWYPEPQQQKRAGLHNDCFLAGPSDSGTYLDAALRGYAAALTEQAAFGGETCEGAELPARASCADILREGAQYHLAWLNRDYAGSVIEGWRAEGCLEQVSRSLGYRLQLDALAHPPRADKGSSVPLVVELRNVGWARLFSARSLRVSLRHRGSGVVVARAAAGDLSSLPAQAGTGTRISVALPLPADAPAGDYDIELSAPDAFAVNRDDARFAIRFANTQQAALGQRWSETSAAFVSGTTLSVP